MMAGIDGNVPRSLSARRCRGCTSCLDSLTGIPLSTEAGKNARGNSCAIIRRNSPNGTSSVILINCRKMFLQSAIKYMHKHGIRQIDAVLLSHEHADAMGGLDDLTRWSKYIQPQVDVYCDASTLDPARQKFPYSLPPGKSTGSGFVRKLVWHAIEPGVFTTIAGVVSQPQALHHLNTVGAYTAGLHITAYSTAGGSARLVAAPRQTLTGETIRIPYLILAFLIDSHILWMSDVREIPDTTRELIRQHASSLSLVVVDGNDSIEQNIYLPHARLPEALALIASFGCAHNLLVGMGHHTVHEGLVPIGRELQGGRIKGDEEEYVNRTRCKVDDEVWQALEAKTVCVRPAYDGLKVNVIEDEGGDHGRGAEGIPI